MIPPAPARRRWLLPAFLLLAISGALAAVFFLLGDEPEPLLVAVAVTQYDAPEWPANPYAEQDARGFAAHFDQPFLSFERQGKAGLLATFRDAVTKANAGERPLVLYLSALGTVVGDSAYLLPSDARTDAESGWLKLDDLLAPLRDAKSPPLLVLDIRPLRPVPAGDVNARLTAELESQEKSGTLPATVLTANTPAGGAAVLYPLQQSLFGLALTHAVGGAADGWTPAGRKDELVRVAEFAAHVIAATADGSRHFGEAQVPRLYRAKKFRDFTLAEVPKGGAEPLPEAGPARAYPPLLAEAWTAAENARKSHFDLRVPGRMRPFVTTAVRAEQRWLAGIGDAAVVQTLEPKPAAFTAVVAARGPIPPPLVSLARQTNGTSFADHGRPAEPLLRKAFDAIRTPTPMLKADVDKELAKVAAVEKIPADVIAAAAFDFAKTLEEPTQEQLRQAFRLATASRERKPFAELATLECLCGLPPGRFAQRYKPEGTVRRVLDAAELGERAAAFDARHLPWLEADLAAADAVRRAALVALCDPSATAADIRSAPVRMDDAGRKYAATLAKADRLHRARRAFEAACAVRDDLTTDGPPDPAPPAGEWERRVREMADAYKQLDERLHAPPAIGDDLGRVVDGLNDRVADLTTARTREPTAPTVRQWERLLEWPHWSAAKRLALRAALFQKSADVTAKVLTGWPTAYQPEPAASPTARVPAGAKARTDTTATPPDADRDAHLAAHKKYVAWRAARYEADAAAIAGVTFAPGFAPAKRWRDVAENCR